MGASAGASSTAESEQVMAGFLAADSERHDQRRAHAVVVVDAVAAGERQAVRPVAQHVQVPAHHVQGGLAVGQ
ncbi:hypothetical protein G6F50_018644 [Rhizopus delemar]|uniref:Uncharacterized protein n=1 Tax=Rhizopus delemar TaxID=936053 RepID=A0A9P6XLI0_9FUNG|nr:hypothetical protein G6F50_018644 [Rhizopus delemar]